MSRFAWWSVRHRWWVVGGWATLVLVLAGLSQAVGAVYNSSVTLPAGYGSQQAQVLLQEHFAQAAGDQDQIVVHVTAGTVTDPPVRDRLQAMFARVARLPRVVGVASPYDSRGQAISRDAATAFATVTFDAQANDLPNGAVMAVINTARAARTPALQVELIGQAIENSESSGPSQATPAGLGIAVVVLLVLFGSVVAMLMPILTALAAIAAGISVNAFISHVMNLNSHVLAIALMIALGVGIDYSLFIVSRFRRLLAEGHDPEQAAATAVNTSGRAVLFAGSIVVLALLGMLVLGVSITNGIAVGAAVEVAFTMAAALTLLPAVFSLLGQRGQPAARPRPSPGGRGRRLRPAELLGHPGVFLLSRIQEEWLAHHDNARAVHEGISRVSGVITSAAIIMIAVFGSFVLGGLRLLQEFGVGFAVAVAVDAFLIRFALLPALMYIIGDRNWQLPAWLDWLPRVRIEPAGSPGASAAGLAATLAPTGGDAPGA